MMCLSAEAEIEARIQRALWAMRPWQERMAAEVGAAYIERKCGMDRVRHVIDLAHAKAEEELYWVMALQSLLEGDV